MPIEFSVEQDDFTALRARLRNEDDGKRLVKDLNKDLKAAADPVKVDVRQAVMALTSVPTEVRDVVATKVAVAVRDRGDAGVKISMPRKTGASFVNASGAFERGWRAPNPMGRGWHQQNAGGAPFFGPAIDKRKDNAREAVVAASASLAERLDGRG